MLPLVTLLSARDGMDCARLGQADDELRTALISLTTADDVPPTVPMRAASCLLKRYPGDAVVISEVSRWMRNPAQLGLALLVASHLPDLPLDEARALAAAAGENPDANARASVHARITDDPRLSRQ